MYFILVKTQKWLLKINNHHQHWYYWGKKQAVGIMCYVYVLWHQCCQIKLYLVIMVILIQIVSCPCPCPVSWLASARPLEAWHPLCSASACQRHLLYFAALRQVTDLAPKYSWQAEIRGRVIEWQGFDQSPHSHTHIHSQEILRFPPSTLRYSSSRWKATQMPACLVGFLHRRLVVSWWRDRCKEEEERALFILFLLLQFTLTNSSYCPAGFRSRSKEGVVCFCG